MLAVISVIDGRCLPRGNAKLRLLQPDDGTLVINGLDDGRHRRCRIAKPRQDSTARQGRPIARHPAGLAKMHLLTGKRSLRTDNDLMRCR